MTKGRTEDDIEISQGKRGDTSESEGTGGRVADSLRTILTKECPYTTGFMAGSTETLKSNVGATRIPCISNDTGGMGESAYNGEDW